MAIHVSSINGMGASTLSGSTITNTGMKAEDHMMISEDFITNAGVGSQSDLAVAQNGTPNMSINVGSGVGYVLNPSWTATTVTETKFWRIKNTANVNVTINANATGNPRITSIFAKVNVSTTPDGDASNVATFVAVDGTAAASPTAPSAPADGNGYLRLANITVASGASSIVTANISSQRFTATLANVGSPNGTMFNGKLSPTVASNDLTLTLLTKSGATPSTTDWVGISVNGNLYKITSALTVSANDGTNWCNSGGAELATNEVDYFVYLGYNATDGITIGFSRIADATIYGDFSTTSTNEKYCRISTISNAATDDPYVVVGRFAATLSGSPYTWTVPTYTPKNLIQRPIFNTRRLALTPQWSASGSMTFTGVTSTLNYYQLNGNICSLSAGASGTTGGTASTSVIGTAPFLCGDTGNNQIGSAYVSIDGFQGVTQIANTTRSFAFYRRDGSNYTLGAGRQVAGAIAYPIS